MKDSGRPLQIAPLANPSPIVSSQCGVDIAALVREDALKEERSESFIVKRILGRHYAKRLKAIAASRENRRAA